MAQLNRYSFAGYYFNQPNVKVRQVTKGSPPLRGSNFIAPGRTGEIWTPKKHGGRMLTLEILVIDEPRGTARMIFDQIQQLAATRTQSPLVNYLDSGPRTAQAEIVNWTAQDIDNVGLVFVGQLDFYLADPWFYGATVSGSVVPNAGLAFGTSVINNISGPRTTWTAVLAGVTSGQPLILLHATQGYTTALSSVADNFSTPYTWTRVDGNNTYQDVEIYIGTGGVGTSGTVTVTAPSGICGGAVVPMQGASTAAALGAIDAHGHGASAYPVLPTLSLTPSAAGEGAFYAVASNYPNYVIWNPAPNGTCFLVPYSSDPAALSATEVLYPATGVPVATSYGANGSPNCDIAGAIVKGSGTPVTLSVTNPGTTLAEKLTLNFLGPIANPTVINTTNNTFVTIATTVAGTKHLIVDTGAATALNDGSNVVGSVTHSGAAPFLTLNPGVNVLQVSGAACTGSTLVTVSLAAPYE